MRRHLLCAALMACLALGGCGSLQSVRMLAPSQFGMEALRPAIFVEPRMSREEREDLLRQVELGRAVVERFWGPLETSPYIVACVSAECSARFGSRGARAAAFGDGAIRLAHNGRDAALVAHEWSHAELYRRVGGYWPARRIPRWFDEGVAVVVANEPLHAEANWVEIQRRGLATPALSDLQTSDDWTSAVRRFGETRVDDPDNLRVVYTTAGHVLRGWLTCAGVAGLKTLLQAVRDGEAFDLVYERLSRRCTAS